MRKCWVFLLAFLLWLPVTVKAQPSTQELLKRIDELSREIKALKRQLEEVQATQEEQEDVAEKVEEMQENIGKLKFWGDMRVRMDSTRAYVPSYWLPTSSGGYALQNASTRENDTLYTTRMRLNAKVKPTENTVVKMRLAFYKIWGMGDDYVTPGLFMGMGMQNNFTYGVRPSDTTLQVDRAYFNWTNIGGYPIWVSFGRRPTTHGPPRQLREGLDYEDREATPSGINFDVPFDGATIGYQYSWPWTGRIRICYGRGFESGFKMPIDRAKDDIDFYGIAWDVLDDRDRDMLLVIQAFKAEGVMDFPSGKIYMRSPFEVYNPQTGSHVPMGYQETYVTTQTNLGDIYEIGATWMHQVDLPFWGLKDVDYFVSFGLSITDPDAWSTWIKNNMNMYVSLLAGPYFSPDESKLDTKRGWALWLGTRIPLPRLHSKLGLEYNYGSRYWIPFAIGTDDPYMDKIATRGHVAEVYWIWDLPTGEPLTKYSRTFLRLGFQYYWFNYTGSASWLGTPVAIKSGLTDQNQPPQVFSAPIEKMSNFYMSLEMYF